MRSDNGVSVESELQSAERQREDRRLRRRAKITAQVHVRGMNLAESFEEVCKTVDLSRDGMLLVGRNKDYTKGQLLEVTFPYSSVRGAQNHAQPAEVVRVVAQSHGKFSVAVHFLSAKQNAAASSERTERRAAPSLYDEGALINESLNESTGEQKSPLVLAFEPDAAAAGVMRSMLEGQGYTFVAVKTGLEALEFLKANVPDVFVAEIETQDVSGRDLSINIRKDARLARVPVILLTRSAEPAHYAESQKLGAVVVCMTKPFQPERLQQVIRLIAPPPQSRGFYGDKPLADELVDRTLAYQR
jgi:CheY-like chemotaxis protein